MEEKTAYIVIAGKNKKHFLLPENIVHVEGIKAYTVFHIKNSSEQFVSSLNLGKYQEQLKRNNFIRVHKSQMVNANEITSYQKARGGKITMSNAAVIAVATRRKTKLLLHLKKINHKSNQKNINTINYYASKQMNEIK